jgi:ubiquinol-cytochrome c reductase cytochrome c1 subunit
MKKTLIALLCFVVPGAVLASGGGVALMKADTDITNKASLQNGAKLFVNYCLSCHNAAFMRYNRMGRDLGITDEQLVKDLIFTGAKVGDTMTVAMNADDAKAAFGVVPPDLSVVARARGLDWLYTYLMSFYKDESRPFGVNNLVFKDVGMPHVFESLQGTQVLAAEGGEHGADAAHGAHTGPALKLETPGSLTPEEYKRTVRDLVNFLDYMGEPAKLERQAIRWKVILFLVFFLVIAYLLKKNYWQDIH